MAGRGVRPGRVGGACRWRRMLVVDAVVAALVVAAMAVGSARVPDPSVPAASFGPQWYQVSPGSSFAPTGSGLRYLTAPVSVSGGGDRMVVVHQTATFSPCTPSNVCLQQPAVSEPGSSAPIDLAMPNFAVLDSEPVYGVAVSELAMSEAGNDVVAVVRTEGVLNGDTAFWRHHVVRWSRSNSGWGAPSVVATAPGWFDGFIRPQISSDGKRLVWALDSVAAGARTKIQQFDVDSAIVTDVLTSTGGSNLLGDFAMSSNGRWLVYARQEGVPNDSLFEVRGRVLDGSGFPDRVIVPGTTSNPPRLVVSGRGRYVGFVSSVPNGTSAPSGVNHVFSWDRDWDNGGDPNLVFDEAGTGNRVQWAQQLDDGALLGANTDDGNARALTNLVMSADGSVLARAAYDRPVANYCDGPTLHASSGPGPRLEVWSQDQEAGFLLGDFAVTNAECDLGLAVSSSGDFVGWLGAPTLAGPATTVRVSSFGPTSDAMKNRDEHLGNHPNVTDGGDPVSLAIGNFHHSEVDVSAPAGVYGIEFARTYNALGSGSGDVGGRWSNSYSQRLAEAGPSAANRQLALSDGRKVTFTPNGLDWSSPRTFAGTLSTAGGGDPTVVLPGGETWTFWRLDDAAVARRGFVKSMSNGAGQTVTVDRDTSGVLQSVTSNLGPAAGRAWKLAFTPTSDGLVQQVQLTTTGTAPTKVRTVVYDYQSPSGGAGWAKTLSSATAPYYLVSDPHRVTTYTVDPDSGRVTDVVIGGAGYSPAVPTVTQVHNIYQADGRVRRQTLDNGDVVIYTWQDPTRQVVVTNTASGDVNTYETSVDGDTTVLKDSTADHKATTRSFTASGGNLAQVTDRGGSSYGYTYDANRRITQRATPDPATGTLPSRNSSGGFDPPAPTAGWGLETWTYVTSAPTDLRVDTYTNAAGEVTKYSYTGANLLPDSVTVAPNTTDQITTSYEISNNRIVSVTDGDGVKTCTDYDPVSGLVTATRAHCDLGSSQQAVTSYTYTDLGQVATRIDPAQQGTDHSWVYDYYGDGSLKSVTDPMNTFGPDGVTVISATTTSYEYLPTGEQSKVTAPGPAAGTGTVTTTMGVARNQPLAVCGTAGAGCRIETTVTPYDGAATFTGKKIYDRSGDLREDWAPGATAPTTYLYGAMGRLDTVTDPTGVVTRYVYDVNGNLAGTNAGTTIAADTTVATDYDKTGRAWQTTSPANAATGNRTSHQVTFDKVGRVRTETTASGTADQIIKTTDYNAAGKPKRTVTKRTDYPASVTGVPIDASVDITYTPGGRQYCTKTRVTAPSVGVAETFTYQATDYTHGQATTQRTSKAGAASCDDAKTDTSKWLISASAFNPADQVVWSQTPQQHLERPDVTATDHANYRTSYNYDRMGRAWKIDTPDPANPGTATVSTRTCFNRRGETTASIAADNAVTLTSYYDTPGLVRTTIDPTGTTYNASDPCASTQVANAKKGATTATYDGHGNRLTRQVWLDNNTTDPNNWVSSTETWGYDPAGRLTSYTNGVDAPVAVAYKRTTSDAPGSPDTGRITHKTITTGTGADTRASTEWYLPSGAVDHVDETQGATTRTVTDTYDAVGRLKTQTVAGSPASTLTYTYNQAGNIIQVDYPAMGGQAAKTAKTWWDLAGTPTYLTLTNGSWWKLDHDQAERLTGVSLAYLAWVPVGTYTLDENGQPLTETLNGNTTKSRTTTRQPATGQASQISEFVDNKTCTWTLADDHAGRLSTITQTSVTSQTCDQPGQTTTYSYDAASQLTSAVNTGTVPDGRPKSWTYTYGNTGNRLTETAVRKGTGGGADTTTTTTSRYNSGRLCATAPTLPTDCNTASGVTTYTYDTAGRRTTLTRPTGQVSMTYAYDPGGRLATTTANPVSGGTDTVTRGYDPAGSLATLNHTNGSTTDTIVNWWDHTGFSPIPQIATTITNTTGLQLSYGYERITSTGNWFAYDPLGSVLPTSTYTVAPNEYDPYGTPANQTPYSTLQYFGYRGEVTYADTIHLRNRDYDPHTGTFTTRDPLDGINGTTTVANPYHYADNEPVGLVDPLGLRPSDQDGVLVMTLLNSTTIPCSSGGADLAQNTADHAAGVLSAIVNFSSFGGMAIYRGVTGKPSFGQEALNAMPNTRGKYCPTSPAFLTGELVTGGFVVAPVAAFAAPEGAAEVAASHVEALSAEMSEIARRQSVTAVVMTESGDSAVAVGARSNLSLSQIEQAANRGIGSAVKEFPLESGMNNHAEPKLFRWAIASEERPTAIAASKDFCSECEQLIIRLGGRITSSRTAEFPEWKPISPDDPVLHPDRNLVIYGLKPRS